jgi:hypothetical protein
MLDRALITSASNKYFPSLINLLGSIKANYPNHPKIYIYDLGLFLTFRKELELLENVQVVKMPKFCAFWRSCYTWKTYIFNNPFATLNFYLDAGCQVLRPLDEIFEKIDRDELFVIGQGVKFKDIVPEEYKSVFELSEEHNDKEALHAGEFGFKNSALVKSLLQKVFDCGLAGLALGFSPGDAWRNKGKDKNIFIRQCKIFRHDLTLLNIILRKYFGNNLNLHSVEQYAGGFKAHHNQYIWHLRMNFKKLDFTALKFLHNGFIWFAMLNRAVIGLMLLVKNFKAMLRQLKQ